MSDTERTDLRAKLADTIAPMLTRNSGTSSGLVGRATRKRAEQIADAVLARINGESLHLVRFTPAPAPNAAPSREAPTGYQIYGGQGQ